MVTQWWGPCVGQLVTLTQVIEECIRSKQAANLRPCYVRELKRYFRKFAMGREKETIRSVNFAHIEQWLNATAPHPATRMTGISRLSALFTFAWRSGYIAENPVDRVQRPRLDRKPPRILTPDESQALIAATASRAPELTAFIGLGMFAGIRPAELQRLDWQHVDLGRGLVRIDAAASKIRQRRIVRLEPAAIAHLNRAPVKAGPITPKQLRRRRWRIEAVMGWFGWPHDLLRHTAASYLLALHGDAGRVAMTLGNSAGVLLRHYHELVSPEDCARFWACQPAAPA